MKQSKKLLSLALALVMALSLAVPAMAAEETKNGSGKITILHTNDTHTYIDNKAEVEDEKGGKTEQPTLRYSTVAGYKASLENVLLVDAGDHVQGTVYGAEDKGETIIKLMAAAGYDLATLGNHEFDYTMEGTKNVVEWAKDSFPYVSCNFFYKDEPVLEPYKVFEVAGKKIAFVGITTPESITKSTPKYFMDENGNYVYSIAGGDDGGALYAAVQTAIDAAAKEADYVIALGHLGVDEASAPWRSEDVIANTTGLTAFIDGHSHSEIPGKEVSDKAGKTVILSQTGTALNNLGELTIDADGTVSARLLTFADLEKVKPDAAVAKLESEFIAKVDEALEKPVGASAVTLNINGSDGKRSVRKEETNIGNFCCDAFMFSAEKAGFEPDLAFNQGGGIRATLPAGEISTKMIKLCYPWGGDVAIKDITGQELLDALEWSYRTANPENTNEVGGYLQLSHVRVTVNLGIPSTVQQDENGVWSGAPTGEYRVQKVEILNGNGEYEPLELNRIYKAVSGPYLLEEMGDGYNMFKSGEAAKFVANDYTTLVDYIQSFPVDEKTGLHTVTAGAGYDEFVHTGRINYINRPTDLDEKEWWYSAAVEALDAGLMKGTDNGFDALAEITEATVYQTLYNAAGNKEAAAEGEEWYAPALAWAEARGLYKAQGAFTDSVISREKTKAILETCAPKAQGLMVGNEKGDMMLDKPLTRGELAQVMVRLGGEGLYFTQETVSIQGGERTVPAIVTLPVGEGKFPAVVINHGHGGNKDEGGGFAGVAQALAKAGIASIRMDFAGCGDSTAPFTQNTLSNMAEDSNAAKDYLLKNYPVDADRLGILGYSMGGRLALELVSGKDNPYKAVVLLSAAANDGEKCIQGALGLDITAEEGKAVCKEKGSYDYTTIYGQELSLSAQWFDDMMVDPLAGIKNYTGPMLVLHGTEDVVVTDEVNKLILAAYPAAQEIIVPEADHGYGFYSDQPAVTEMVEGSISGFFQAGLAGK